jgi:hypothetical protein
MQSLVTQSARASSVGAACRERSYSNVPPAAGRVSVKIQTRFQNGLPRARCVGQQPRGVLASQLCLVDLVHVYLLSAL